MIIGYEMDINSSIVLLKRLVLFSLFAVILYFAHIDIFYLLCDLC